MKEQLSISDVVDVLGSTGMDEDYWQAHRDSMKLVALEMDKEADARRTKELWCGRRGPPASVTQGGSAMEHYASWLFPRMETPDHDDQNDKRKIMVLGTKTISRKLRARLHNQEVTTYVMPITQRARARVKAKNKEDEDKNRTRGSAKWIIFHYQSLDGKSQLMQVRR